MPTIECDKQDCRHIGEREQICIARKVEFQDGQCITFQSGIEALMQKFNPRCHKENGKWRSDRREVRK